MTSGLDRPEVVSPAQLPSQLVVESAAHLPESAATQVAAQAVLVPVLLNGLQEEAVADALLAAAAGQQRRRHLEDLVHWLPGKTHRRGYHQHIISEYLAWLRL